MTTMLLGKYLVGQQKQFFRSIPFILFHISCIEIIHPGKKRDMVSFKIDPNIWEKLSDDRDSWRKKLSDGVVAHDSAWFDLLSKKRDLRHQRMAQPPTSPGTQFVCGRCDRRCRSRIGLVSHQRKCQSQTT
ncbi:hypothetical protein B5X24_HaOG208874 [Helicoverpa armigera]|nr:hypothetical protein B5X24_HaOG208874 [Helicoverpa armigera]